MQDTGRYHFICYFSENSVLLLIIFTFLLCCHISSSCAISMYNLHESLLALVICDVNLSPPPLIVEFPNQMFNKTARCLLFNPLIYQKLFFHLSWVIHVKLNLNILGVLGIKRLLTGEIASCSLSSIWSSFTEHPVDIDQLKLIMLLVGTPGPELLKKLSSESVSSKGLHKRCAITHICADALTACFPP